jgi:ATP synthase F1 complex assembly factor 2
MLTTRQGRMGVDAAIDATRLEEATQIEEWGLVEGGHDIDHSDLKVRVHLVLRACTWVCGQHASA